MNEWGEPQDDRNVSTQPNTALFNLEIKPKDPPMFYGRVAEDVSTWISKVSDFFYLTRAMDIMVSICAHAPMSLRARTSVSDDRSEIKVTGKVWF